jgi:excisionase family DNA binding protein
MIFYEKVYMTLTQKEKAAGVRPCDTAKQNMEVNSVSESSIEKWSTLKEVQEYLGVGRETILQWIAKRKMPAYKVGRLWKFKLSEVDEWIRSGGAAESIDAE